MSENRKPIDPENRYPSPGLRGAERIALRVLETLRYADWERTRDVFQFTQKGTHGIVIVITPEAVEFRLPTVEWTYGCHGPAASSRLYKRVEHAEVQGDALQELIQEAQAARKAQFRACRYCGKTFPSEHRHSEDVCHSCASQHLGVIY